MRREAREENDRVRQEDERVSQALIEHDAIAKMRIHHLLEDTAVEINQVEALLVYHFSNIGDPRGDIRHMADTSPLPHGDTSLTSAHQHSSQPSVLTPPHEHPSPLSESVKKKNHKPTTSPTRQFPPQDTQTQP